MGDSFETDKDLERWRGTRIRFHGNEYKKALQLFAYRLLPDDIVLGSVIADANISPNLWMAKYARTMATEEPRTELSMRSTVINRRLWRERWGIKLWNVRSYVTDVMMSLNHRVAPPEDRLAVLPRALDAIQQGELLNIFFFYRSDDPETYRRTWLRTQTQEVVSSYQGEKKIDARSHAGWYLYDPSPDFCSRIQDIQMERN